MRDSPLPSDSAMTLRARPYRDTTDLARLRRLLVTGARAGISASYTHPGLLDYDMHCPPDEAANRRNFRLWERPGEGDMPPVLEAFALFWRHFKAFDLFVSPAIYGTPTHETVFEEYVTWAEARAREAGATEISPFWVLDRDAVTLGLMASRGFSAVPVDPPAPLFERTLDDLPAAPLPDGFTVQGVSTPDDGRLRASVTHGAFCPNEDWEGYRADYARFMASEVYDGARDLFVRSPDGRGASSCTLWFDTVNLVGLFEPVATHPDFQRQGLGKAVMAEGMRRMKAAGMRRAILGFDPNNVAAERLYRSLGFRTAAYFAACRKEL